MASISRQVRYFSLDQTELEESGGLFLLLFDADTLTDGVRDEILGFIQVVVELDSECN